MIRTGSRSSNCTAKQSGSSTRSLARDNTYVSTIEVLPRDRGIGSAVLNDLAARGALRLHVFTVNTRARALYERHGFVASGEEEGRLLMEHPGRSGQEHHDTLAMRDLRLGARNAYAILYQGIMRSAEGATMRDEPKIRGGVTTILVTQETTLPADRVLEAARDFSDRRAQVFPAVSSPRMTVHATSDTTADVTEATRLGPFVLWERCRYDWSSPDRVTATVTDSNVYGFPGSTWEIVAVPTDGGSRVDMTWTRGFQRRPLGRVMGFAYRRVGERNFTKYAHDILKNLEALDESSGTFANARSKFAVASKGRRMNETARVIEAFTDATNRHDLDAMLALVSEQIVFETTTPPDGERLEGKAAVRAVWDQLFRESPHARVETEQLIVSDDRATAQMRYVFDSEDPEGGHVRAVDILRVTGGLISEKLSYVKG